MLIGSFAIHNRACPHLMEYSFRNLKDILEDSQQSVRDAAAWVFMRLSVTADGKECIRDTQSADQMIASFIKHSSHEGLEIDKGKYLIRLLEAFVNITFNDFGIEPLLGKEAISQFVTMLLKPYVAKQLKPDDYKMTQILCLRVLGNMSINHQGKQECIDNEVIQSCSWFLDEDFNADSFDYALNASLVLMSCSIHLDGKK